VAAAADLLLVVVKPLQVQALVREISRLQALRVWRGCTVRLLNLKDQRGVVVTAPLVEALNLSGVVATAITLLATEREEAVLALTILPLLTLAALALRGLSSLPNTHRASSLRTPKLKTMSTITLSPTQAADPAQVQAALNAAADGDAISLPKGDYTWNKQVSCSGKSIRLLGDATSGTTLINNIPPPSNWKSQWLIYLTGSNRSTLEVANLAFKIGSANTSGGFKGTAQISLGSAPGRPYYLHDCSVRINGPIAKGLQLFTNGGLVSKCKFQSDLYSYSDGIVMQSSNDTYKSVSTLGTLDDGTKNTYVEDCEFVDIGVGYSLDMSGCARMVVRHCKFINSYIGSHGQESDPFGCRHYEIYDCEFRVPNLDSNTQDFCWLRGGTGVIFDNSFDPSYYKSCVMMQILSLTKNEQIGCQTDYPVPRQVGQGWSGGEGSYSYPGWPANGSGYITDALYIWDNTKNASAAWVTFGDSSPDQCGNNLHSRDFIKENRDYYLNAGPKPGYTPYQYPHPLASGQQPPIEQPPIEQPPTEPPVEQPPSGGEPETIDGADSRVSFSGGWRHTTDEIDVVGGTMSYSVPASAKLEFSGTGIEVIVKTAPNKGKANIVLDGTQVAIVDLFSMSYLHKVVIFSKTGLPTGVHTIELVSAESKNSNSTGTVIDLDSFRVTP
jgi:hypothetical protein